MLTATDMPAPVRHTVPLRPPTSFRVDVLAVKNSARAATAPGRVLADEGNIRGAGSGPVYGMRMNDIGLLAGLV